MTTYTIYATSFATGFMFGRNATYSTARSTVTLGQFSATIAVAGQTQAGDYFVYQAASRFDCSVIDSGETVSSAILNQYCTTDQSIVDFIWEVRQIALGAAMGTEDWIAGASLSGSTLLTSFNSSGVTASAYNQWSDDAAMISWVDAKSATTDIHHSSSRQRVGNVPTGNERFFCSSQNETGTSQDPYLDVTAAAAGATVPIFHHHYNQMKAA